MNLYRKIYININSICNCRCINCILKEENRQTSKVLQIKDVKELIGTIKCTYNDGHHNIVEISGGEPTLHPEFINILSILYQAKIEGFIYKITLLTNGISSENTSFCTSISKYLDDVVITLYDTDPVTHDEFTRTSGSFYKKIKAIDNFISYGVKVHIKLLVIKPSYKHLPEMARYIADRWGNQVHVAINGTHYTGDAYKNKESLSFRYSDAVEYIEQALDILLENNIVSSIFFPLCLLDPIYWKLSPYGFKDLIDKSISISPTYELGKANRLLDEFINRSELCEDCVLISRCNWPWKKYSEILGEKEIAAAKKTLYENIITPK